MNCQPLTVANGGLRLQRFAVLIGDIIEGYVPIWNSNEYCSSANNIVSNTGATGNTGGRGFVNDIVYSNSDACNGKAQRLNE